ncbi:hypothetical protein [Streptomyces kanamyceticus]|uniref:Secreted protein n=1 Tax=Streptomyces kanamyceticus TaxID=1967 RepID=A0A5J6GM56_STRKN|nr:hypothetical protein [Streptomyces kanamyceticus]QEU96529.1 hypothetical protein CP970_41305 [Streptomyces kanamyceticus]
MRRVSRVVTTALAAFTLAAVSPGAAHALPSADAPPPAPATVTGDADDGLPEGWRLAGDGGGKELVWDSPEAVPMGDARVEFYSGDKLLGRPVAAQDRRSFRLPLHGARVGEAKELRVLAGGRRLDEAGNGQRQDTRRPAAPTSPGKPLPEAQVDPGKPGSYRTVSGEYTLKSVRLPGFPELVEMRAKVVGPVDAPGNRPLALFLHGRHYTCYGGSDDEGGGWPCAAGTKPVPSQDGYLRTQKLLASQGYVTVSVAANGINGQDHLAEDGGAQARSSLVRLHLAQWADWAKNRSTAPAAVRAVAPADLSRVLLVGHSRGGEGVNRAALDSLSPPPAEQDGYRGPVRWKIRGNVLIGPTIFGQNPVPDVPSATILPGCDGDVSDLQGEIFVDGTRGVSRGKALHSAVYMVGANHNFFNSEWTPGQAKAPATDDFGSDGPDPVCTPGTKTRLTAPQQQQAGATYIAAAARLFVAGDDRVRPLLDGSGRRAPSAGRAQVLTHAVGAGRTAAFLPDPSTKVKGGRVCAQVDTDTSRTCLSPRDNGASPHFAGWETSPEPGRDAVAMKWSRSGAPVRVTPARPVSLAGAKELALRVIVPPNTKGTALDVSVVDKAGHRAKLGKVGVDGLPGSEMTTSYWARELRVPMSAAVRAGLDLKNVRSLELTPRTRSGKAWLMDAWGWRPGTPEVKPAELPRVDIGRLKVKEGDSGTKTYHVPVSVSGKGSGQVRLFQPKPGSTGEFVSRLVTVRPGGPGIDVPVEVRGNTRYGYDVAHDAFVKAVRGAVVGSHHGGVTAQNDDPMPKVTMEPVADRVTEGKPLKWRLTLSEAVDVDIQGEIAFLPVTGGAELSTLDVDPRWLKDEFDAKPRPGRALSKMAEGSALYVSVPAGKKSVEVRVPTVKDDVREPDESLKAQLSVYDENWEPQKGPVFTGTVRNAS